MKKQTFRYIGPNAISESGNEISVTSYGGKKVKNGATVELEGHFVGKAMINPNYEVVEDAPKQKAAQEVREQMFGLSAKEKASKDLLDD